MTQPPYNQYWTIQVRDRGQDDLRTIRDEDGDVRYYFRPRADEVAERLKATKRYASVVVTRVQSGHPEEE